MSDISERAYNVVTDLMHRTSRAPSAGEIAKAVEAFALRFAYDAGLRLVPAVNEDSAHAIRNAVSRAAAGEP